MQIFIAILLALFLLMIVLPAIQHKRQRMARLRVIRQLERRRHSRVITLIHRQERISFLGIPLMRFIDMEDAEQVLRAIRLTPREMPIDLILHTPGGLLLPTQQIAYALRQHPAPVTAMIPHYAMSGGTLVALSADQILMDANAMLGPVDPQIIHRGEILPASSVLSVLETKDRSQLGDDTIMMADIANKASRQMRGFLQYLLEDKIEPDRARSLAETLTEGRWTHDFPLNVPLLQKLELPVSIELPEEIYQLMGLYPQPMNRPSAVQYVPEPYRRDGRGQRHR